MIWRLICTGEGTPSPITNGGKVQACVDGTMPIWQPEQGLDILSWDQDAISIVMLSTLMFYVAGLGLGAILRLLGRFGR
ncbi:MAG: hypothetical protein HQL84_12005 [Magnetococcales bacterium]|nr:hypothetical protein [Magnetococcales bacterium]MBF0150757.1 hypothetical protein [Magnetococcales bacterium]MBF0630140.1 hypothetical protein [Magnetococcales bacterium]